MARISIADYETVTVACDHCGKECVFNRREDFSQVGPYAGENVLCTCCHRGFRMISDTINPPHELFLFAARKLFQSKRYMQAATSMAQAWELFFAAFAGARYIYRPFFSMPDDERDLEKLNALQAQMDHELRRFTFWPLRNLLVNTVVEGINPKTLDDAATAIELISAKALGNDPKADGLLSLQDLETRGILDRLLALTIGQLRNNVTHHRAYRPLKTELEQCLEGEVALMYKAQRHFGVRSFGELSAGIW